MYKKDAKLLLIGLDGAMPDLVRKFSDEGTLPHLHQLIEGGSFLEVLPSPPCDTPTNWTTIVTGAWTGTHGATGFGVHLPGDTYNDGLHCAFDTRLCQAEYLWNVAERKGLTPLLYDYPPCRPATLKNGIVLGGWFNPNLSGQGVASFYELDFIDNPPYPSSLLRDTSPDMLHTPLPAAKGMKKKSLSTTLEEAHQEYRQYVRTMEHLKKTNNWDVFFCHLHLPDYLTHMMLNNIWDEHPDYDPEQGGKGWSAMREAYRIIDEITGEIVERFASDKTIICVISDHGGLPSSRLVWPGAALERAGLTRFAKDNQGDYHIDIAHSKALFYFGPSEYIWINLEGRDPGGIVKPGKEYEEVQTRIINALLDIRDPENGKCAYPLVIRKQEADFIGQWGERCGDVIAFAEPGYTQVDFSMTEGLAWGLVEGIKGLLEMGDLRIGGDTRQGSHHGYFPTHRIGPFSVSGVAILSGKDIKPGYARQHPAQMVDIAPTLAHLLGWPKPAQAEGGLLWDIMKNSYI